MRWVCVYVCVCVMNFVICSQYDHKVVPFFVGTQRSQLNTPTNHHGHAQAHQKHIKNTSDVFLSCRVQLMWLVRCLCHFWWSSSHQTRVLRNSFEFEQKVCKLPSYPVTVTQSRSTWITRLPGHPDTHHPGTQSPSHQSSSPPVPQSPRYPAVLSHESHDGWY
jgi:hypothetical protein